MASRSWSIRRRFLESTSLLENGTMVLVRGKVERDEESGRLFAAEIRPLDTMRERLVREIGIRLSLPPHGRPTFQALLDVFTRHRGDRRVFFELELRGHQPALRVRAALSRQVLSQALEPAGRRPRTDLRDGVCIVAVESGSRLEAFGPPCIEMPAEILEFEEPIAALLKENHTLLALPATPARDLAVESLRRRVEALRAEILQADALAARAGGASP